VHDHIVKRLNWQGLWTRAAVGTLAVVLCIGVGIIIGSKRTEARLTGALLSRQNGAAPPSPIEEQARMFEDLRVSSALWQQGIQNKPITSWQVFRWRPANDKAVLAVRVSEWELAQPAVEQRIACTLLLPPANLNQQLFAEVRVFTAAPRSADKNSIESEIGAAYGADHCADDKSESATCNYLINAEYELRNTERLRITLPFDMKNCPSTTTQLREAVKVSE
jgi:hypothetical protein